MCAEQGVCAAQDEVVHDGAQLIALLRALLYLGVGSVRLPACHNRRLHRETSVSTCASLAGCTHLLSKCAASEAASLHTSDAA